MEEIWKDIEGYEGIYQISNIGRIKSLARKRVLKDKIKTNCFDRDGYGSIILYNEGSFKTRRIHRLVAQAFIENPDNLPEVNHIDGIKTNNHAYNLEWVTKKQNNEHALKIGLIKVKGADNANSKLDSEDVVKIKLLLKAGVKNNVIAKMFGMSNQMISNIKLEYNWKEL